MRIVNHHDMGIIDKAHVTVWELADGTTISVKVNEASLRLADKQSDFLLRESMRVLAEYGVTDSDLDDYICNLWSVPDRNKQLKTTAGETIIPIPDGATVDTDEGWFKPLTNPFLHGCCDCGLMHKVEYTLCDDNGGEIPLPERAGLVLRFSRDNAETAHLRQKQAMIKLMNMTPQHHEVVNFLDISVPPGVVEDTTFSGVAIKDLSRESLLKLVALLAAGKKEESRIIRF